MSRWDVPSDLRSADVPVAYLQLATVGVVLFVLVLSSPLLGAVDLTPPERDSLGDGTANVTLASDPATDLYVDRGRFGTRVFYLRLPPLETEVHSVTGRPRVVYQVRVPNLSFERTATSLVGSTGAKTVRMDPRAFTLSRVDQREYEATVEVRVQSFEMDRTVATRNVTIPVYNRTHWGGP